MIWKLHEAVHTDTQLHFALFLAWNILNYSLKRGEWVPEPIAQECSYMKDHWAYAPFKSIHTMAHSSTNMSGSPGGKYIYYINYIRDIFVDLY